jgi:uncharacterized protein with FMN-binding domain
MKKFVVSLVVFVIYAIYSIGIRHVRPVLPKPAVLAKSSTSNSAVQPTTSNSVASSLSKYRDGTYAGSVNYVYYGNVQVSVTISGGKITNAKFLQYPNSHSTSVYINQQVMPYLQQELIKSQNPNKVQIISGATFTSEGFIKSIQSALNQA